jgi:hypothetical protein
LDRTFCEGSSANGNSARSIFFEQFKGRALDPCRVRKLRPAAEHAVALGVAVDGAEARTAGAGPSGLRA